MGRGSRGVRVRARGGGDARRARRARAGALVPRRGEDGIAARERAFEGYVRTGAATRPPASRSGSRTSTSSPGGRRPRAAGWRAPSAPSRARAVRGPGLGRGRAGAARRDRRGVRRARAPRDGDRARVGRRRPRGLRAQPARARRGHAGRLEEGMRLLEEAMAAASAGRVRNVHTLAEAYCNLIMASTSAGDWERATEWCELVDEFAREHDDGAALGACRTIHADVLLATGRWAEAEHALETALDTHARYVPADGRADGGGDGRAARPPGPACRGRAAARRPRGASVVAARARPPAHRPGPAAGGGGAARARAASRPRATRCERRSCSRRSSTRASPRATSTGATAARSCSPSSRDGSGIRSSRRARSSRPRASRSRRGGRTRPPRPRAARSRAFGRLAMPLDVGGGAARARPRARDEPRSSRVDEARAALAAFRELGASRAMDAAAAVLRELGASTRRPAARGRRAHRARAGGARADRARDVERARSPRRS